MWFHPFPKHKTGISCVPAGPALLSDWRCKTGREKAPGGERKERCIGKATNATVPV
jgi:hypothetical protein